MVIKRVMPRQNEEVNEIWICDKGRFTHHYVESPERLTTPLIRKDGELVKATWEEAVAYAAQQVKAAGSKLAVITSGRLSNEDLYTLNQFAEKTGGKAILHTAIAGGDWVSRYGLTTGSDLKQLGAGSTIMVFASDLHEEAPIWWLRVKQAAERGATLVVANGRKTRLEKFASHTLRYAFGEEARALDELLDGKSEVTKSIRQAENLVVFYGSDGLGLSESAYVAERLAGLLESSGHYGKSNNGMVAVWPKGNDQGAWELGFKTDEKLEDTISAAMGVYIAAADPASEDPALRIALQRAGFIIVQDLFLTETAKLANVVFPAQAVMERAGTMVSGERRVQRYHAAIPPAQGTRPDHEITSAIAAAAGMDLPVVNADELFVKLAETEAVFNGLTLVQLAETREQWPTISRSGIYFGGASFDNKDGLGVILPARAERPQGKALAPATLKPSQQEILAVPVTRLYDRGGTVTASGMLKERISQRSLSLHPKDAEKLKVSAGERVVLRLSGRELDCALEIDAGQPEGVVLVTRSMGALLAKPELATLWVPEKS
jgi:NADH-quinone oxidoreductase subunit G